ncbi:hypothetical protein CJ031_08260 [Bacillus velezensis]|nr:hypothetical protein CJ031_08260 [Bacillus velezensis]
MKSNEKGRYPAFRLSRKSRQPLCFSCHKIKERLKKRCLFILMFHTRNFSRNTAEFVLFDQLVEEDHLLRKIDKYIDFSFIVEKVKPYCSAHLIR